MRFTTKKVATSMGTLSIWYLVKGKYKVPLRTTHSLSLSLSLSKWSIHSPIWYAKNNRLTQRYLSLPLSHFSWPDARCSVPENIHMCCLVIHMIHHNIAHLFHNFASPMSLHKYCTPCLWSFRDSRTQLPSFGDSCTTAELRRPCSPSRRAL